MMQYESQSSRVPAPGSRTLERYKKRLLVQVVAIFSFCLIVILERIFYEVIIESQQGIISSLQLSTDLTNRNQQGTVVPYQITNQFLKLLASLSQFRWQFLIFTHVMATLYVAVDALIAAKLLYVSMAIIYLVSLLQLFYAGQRPFWNSQDILTSDCLANYSHPNLGLILSLFVPYYFFYCWKKRSGKVFLGQMKTSQYLFFIGMFVVVAVLQFMNYFTGSLFLINIALSIVCFLLVGMVVVSLNSLIDQAIRKSTLIKVDAKKYVFYWLLFICLIQTFILIVYAGQDIFLDIDWVKNYISCTKYLDYQQTDFRYDEVIGPWFNFMQTAAMFGWIGAVFGVSACYRKMAIAQWAQGPKNKRIMRALIANLMIVPSWLFISFLEKGSWIKDIGLNEFIVDGVHFFVLYLWIFGYMPYFVLEKALKLTNRQNEDYYVILSDKK